MYFSSGPPLGAASFQPAIAMTTSSQPDDDDDLVNALRRSRVLEDAPEALIQRSIDLFQSRSQSRPHAAAAPVGLRRRLVAMLDFDSAGMVPSGVRGGSATTRQLLFTAEGRDIDLRLQPEHSGSHWRVSGQVLGPDLQGTATLQASGYSADVAWNALAEFSFEQVPTGPFSVLLRTPDWELVLPDLHAGEAG